VFSDWGLGIGSTELNPKRQDKVSFLAANPLLSLRTEKKGEALQDLDFRHWQQIYRRNADAPYVATAPLTPLQNQHFGIIV
jgi:hypothetical protein